MGPKQIMILQVDLGVMALKGWLHSSQNFRTVSSSPKVVLCHIIIIIIKLIHTVRIYSQDIGMEFGKEKCAMLVMKGGKRHLTDGMGLPNQDKIRTLGEKETYKYLGILEADTIKQVEMKEKIQKEYLRRTRKLLETKLCRRSLNKGINTWAVALVRYSGPILKWTREKLKQIDQRRRKLMTMHEALHPRDDVDRLYVSRKEAGRGLANSEDSVDAWYNDSRTT